MGLSYYTSLPLNRVTMFKLFNPSGLDPSLLIGLLDGLNEEAGEPWNGRNSISSSFYLSLLPIAAKLAISCMSHAFPSYCLCSCYSLYLSFPAGLLVNSTLSSRLLT